MFKFLEKPYPFNDDYKHNIKIILALSIGISILLFIFEPFEINEFPFREKIYTVLGIGIVTFISLSFNLLFLPAALPNFFTSEEWNIKREIFWNGWILFTISLGYFLYNEFSGFSSFELSFMTIVKTILISLIPISILIFINQDRMLRMHIKSASEITERISEKRKINEKLITINSDYQKGSLTVKVVSILYIKSAGNYIDIYWKSGDQIENRMIRTSLKKVEDLLVGYEFIFRSHRSYLINIEKIEKVEGNDQGYKLYLSDLSEPLPVSKSYTTQFHQLV